MIVNGRQLAEKRREEVREIRKNSGPLSLGVVIPATDTVTQSYVGIKKRAAEALNISVTEYRFPNTPTLEDIIAKIKEAEKHDGIILQLPLPEGVDLDQARNSIPKEKDVDVLGDSAFAAFSEGKFPAVPPVPAAMYYVLKENKYDLKGKKVVFVGRGRLVGKPGKVLFEQLGATVSLLGRADDVPAHTKEADVIVLGVGKPGLLTPEMIKEGVVILDAGASEASGKVVGDADPRCADKASLFTPVPGGIGPIAVVEIFANLVALKEMT